MARSIALYGRTGSGKSTIAHILEERGYQHLRTGLACRTLCLDLFGAESKTLMNQVTDALRAIDPSVWLRAALRHAASGPIVFDSMRFPQDYVYLRDQGYLLVKVVSRQSIRLQRLDDRGQEYTPHRDDVHDAEIALDSYNFDYSIENSGEFSTLQQQVAALLDEPRTD